MAKKSDIVLVQMTAHITHADGTVACIQAPVGHVHPMAIDNTQSAVHIVTEQSVVIRKELEERGAGGIYLAARTSPGYAGRKLPSPREQKHADSGEDGGAAECGTEVRLGSDVEPDPATGTSEQVHGGSPDDRDEPGADTSRGDL